MQPQGKAFTTSSRVRRNVLRNEVYITKAFNPTAISKPISPQSLAAKKYIAIWDTGATNTIITQKVVNDCGLKPIGMAQLNTANDKRDSLVYLVAIFLPNQVFIPELSVTEATVTSDAEILIGMDIMGNGDFAVTHKDNKTVFSFRMPSLERIDFTKQEPPKAEAQITKQLPKVGRNDPCPCGSGKKYKKCCGR